MSDPAQTACPRAARRPAGAPRLRPWGWAALLLALASAGTAQEEITVRRFADLVAVRQGATARERVLYYFNPTAALAVGDEVQQGGGGHAELSLSAAGRVSVHDEAHIHVVRLDPVGDVLRFAQLTRASAVSGDRVLTLVLPNGARCVLDGARVELRHELGRLLVRNTGALPVMVRGALEVEPGMSASPKSLDKIVLAKGEEVRMPYFGEPAPLDQPQVTEWAGLVVRHDDGAEVTASEGRLDVRALRATELRVAGVRTTLGEGQVLVVRNRRQPGPSPTAAEGP